MKLKDVAEQAGYTVDKGRRRLNSLCKDGVIERVKLNKEQGRWDYPETAVEILKTLMHYEEDLGLTATDGIRRILEESLGGRDPDKTVAELEAELIGLRQANALLKTSNRQLTHKLKDVKANHLPVEREGWLKRAFRSVVSWVSK